MRTQSRDPHQQRGVGFHPPRPYPLLPFFTVTEMETKRIPKVIFICPVCGNASRIVPICGVFSSNGGVMYPVALCIECGPLNLELLEFCREAVLGTHTN